MVYNGRPRDHSRDGRSDVNMQMTFPLDNAAQKPMIALGNFPGCTALIDTGAMLPMWSMANHINKLAS